MGGVLGGRDAVPGEISMDEVKRHNTKTDAWIVLFNEAIDVTRFLARHPGGEESITAYLGKDATRDWQMIHEPKVLEQHMEHLTKMGKVDIAAQPGLLSWLFGIGAKPGGTAAPTKANTRQSEANTPATSAEPAATKREPVRWSAEHEGELPPGGVFDLKELARWDGVQLPMCVGICGLVIDVSSSDNFIPDFGYGKLWAGKDTTWAMATVSLKAHDANRFDFNVDELPEEQHKALAGWYKHFTHKYRKVGTLREFQSWDFTSVVQAADFLPTSSMSKTAGEEEEEDKAEESGEVKEAKEDTG